MKRSEGVFDGVAALIAGAEFACFGFGLGWVCRKSNESE